MSWKASGYVKDLRDGLSVPDKLVLLVLADYHRTDEKSAWPSTVTLAQDCLMSDRGVRQILARLEKNGFIVKKSGCGRGNVTGYKIVGVDIVNEEPQTRNIGSTFPVERWNGEALKVEPGDTAIRKEPLEPIKQTLSVPSEPTSEFSLNSESNLPKKNGCDPRHKVFMEQIQKAHEHFVRDVGGKPVTPLLGPAAGHNLKRLLQAQKDLTVDQFRRWLTNYHQSENHNPYDSPAHYILKLPTYEGGPVNQFGRLEA